jgi:hypothetical protein
MDKQTILELSCDLAELSLDRVWPHHESLYVTSESGCQYYTETAQEMFNEIFDEIVNEIGNYFGGAN